ncbi:MAG: OmpA family protein [Bacteroidales bacterium]|nr:OmpA family protein [Bacteroidales bacterium]MBK9358408.1 OmpA family protein [Bacteroidales bacterium]
MKKLLLVLIGLAFALSINAQTADKRWNIGLHGGAIQYNGDLGNDFFRTDQAFYGFGGLSFSRFLGNRLDVSLLLTKGETGYMGETSRFRHQLTTGTINFRLNLIGADYFVRPYLFAGGGVMMFANTLTDVKNNEKFDFAAPSFGAGLNLRLGKAVTLNLQETIMYSSSDERDDVVKNSNDFFLFHSVGLTFNFGQKKDADNDGIADRLDKCPGTPATVKVDDSGCPYDNDKDGIADYLDKCDNTPADIQVDKIGCPLDEDKDGVPDYLDKCLKTNQGVKVDQNGCALDSDNDGVTDQLDKCPNTPASIQVDQSGCPLDEDKDGVADYLDKCPQTPVKASVDEFGCTLDSDKDGIPDYQDKCPTIAGTKENQGCPELTKEVKTLFQKALQGIKFDTGKSTIKPVSFPILDAVVKVMVENPSYKLIIGGHTDNVGAEGMNMTLSKNRAESVSVYLIGKGISPDRISATGYGLTRPVDDNNTAAGRTRNRRVELSVEFIEKVTVPVKK